MTKYKVLTLIISYQIFVTFVVNSLGGSSGTIEEPSQITYGDGIVFVWDIVKQFLKTFWDIMSFQVPDLPYWISMTFYISSFLMFLLIGSLIRGTD
jgi:hypothetical protein